jgi:hypothetical protein
MSLITLMREIGEDADLLARSDEWLEAERRSKAADLDKAAKELRAIILAQQIKTALQQKNLVAVQQILRDADGEIRDIIIRIMNLPDAIAMLAPARDTIDELNIAAQLHGWDKDGYDINRSAALR